MKKIIWAILGLALLWIIADFSYGMIQEKQAQKQAEEQTQQIKEEKQADLEEGNNTGQLAYDFEAEDMDGNAVKLSDYRGKKVFLNFWASWCPPCKIEMPHLKAFS
ncbi:TlpA disulfide reductase family protein [Carnobacterium mobile]|uniref:TlpA disulfide reductase family protein n=1 Tax=Carnobacterium mobile TaxID=2750 RepID=UPI00068AAF5D|nr:TlpA disulfide reductase family protein [Carnobacterium mobile]